MAGKRVHMPALHLHAADDEPTAPRHASILDHSSFLTICPHCSKVISQNLYRCGWCGKELPGKQDRRAAPRITTAMDCQLIFEGMLHRAFLLEISMKGALVLTRLQLPNDSEVLVQIDARTPLGSLTLTGKTMQRDPSEGERSLIKRLVVKFNHGSQELIEFMDRLARL